MVHDSRTYSIKHMFFPFKIIQPARLFILCAVEKWMLSAVNFSPNIYKCHDFVHGEVYFIINTV